MDTETQTAPVEEGQGASAPEGGSVEAELTQTPEPGVQPETDGAEEQPQAGQDFIAPYLADVPEQHREVVADVLEKYRKDSDANVTKKFEQLNAYQAYAPEPEMLETPVAIYENLMERPVDTLEWVIQRFQDEAGVDLKSQLLERLGVEGQASEEPTPASDEDDPNRPMTRAEFEKLQQEQRESAQAERQRQQQIQTVEGWLSEAVKNHGLDIEENDVVLKEAILKQAATLMPKFKRQHGDDAGRVAVDTAVEAFSNRFGRTSAPSPDPSPEPRVADGGMPPAPAEPTLETAEDRKRFMLSRLGLNNQE